VSPVLHVVVYHYIRDFPNTAFPRLKGMLTEAFRRQFTVLQDRYEMATLETALEFVQGRYRPRRDLCLLTFDDGLKEHYSEVMPLLAEHHVQGIFFPITFCLEEGRVAPVHMNHFLMAASEFESYQKALTERLAELFPNFKPNGSVDEAVVKGTYRWDTVEVARFKYLINFVLEPTVRDQVMRSLFEERLGAEREFARTLYFTWDEAREMQAAGMVLGGHSHHHRPLARLSHVELVSDLSTNRQLLTDQLHAQAIWPFSYPFGEKDSINGTASSQLKQLGFACAFSTAVGSVASGTDLFTLLRLDCNDAPMA
jgi:peptidoglycan/xylan/chitin deacetylase (PgdA/CDA1 family)